MAEVRQATDVRLGRTVAVKRLRTDLAADPTFQARFRREAQAAAGLNHPNIVAVYDTGEEMAPDGTHVQPYIVMEYVAGRTLRDVLNDGRKVLPERALELISGVLAALEYSHRAGIVHRDIKPANVMLTPTGDVKVMDFGIARAVEEGSSSVTQTAAVVGTAQYLSPEQARGETVDFRSDVYSTGCLLYELLTGRPPFVGDSAFSVAYQHVREQADPPSLHNPDLPPALDSVVMKALSKRVEDRYQSAAQMQADVRRHLDGLPVEAPTAVVPRPPVAPASAAGATSIFSAAAEQGDEQEERRSRWPLVLLGLVLLALLIGGLLYGTRLLGSTDPGTVTVPSVRNLTLAQAEQRLTAEGLELGPVRREADDNVRRGLVVSQDPGARQRVESGSEVALVVSAGSDMVTVPYVLGLSREEAQARLAEAGLDATFTARESDEPKNTVIGTQPNIADSVPAGSTVTVFVSTGPVEVPNVVGLTERQATARLVAAELRYVIERDPTTPAERGRVLAQDPNGLTEVPRGSTVTITVSSYEEPTPTPTQTPTVEPTTPVPTTEPTTPSATADPPDDDPEDDVPGRGQGRGSGEPEE